VRPFLANVLRGRRVPPERVEEVAHHYELFGGRSPITEITNRQAAALRARLASEGPALPVYVGMRNWHPFLADTLERMAREGVRRAVGFILAAHHSYSSCGQYRQNVLDARHTLRARGLPDIHVIYTGSWFAHPSFIAANARQVLAARTTLPAPLQARARLVFTAHSIPRWMAAASQYEAQLRESARLVAGAAGGADWALVYQSRSGRPEDPWLEPDIVDYLRAERSRGLDAVILCPIGFVADHLEVLYDLDREALGTCEALGLPAARASTVNDDPLFVEMMVEVVRETCARYRPGVPLELLSAAHPERVEGPPPARGAGMSRP